MPCPRGLLEPYKGLCSISRVTAPFLVAGGSGHTSPGFFGNAGGGGGRIIPWGDWGEATKICWENFQNEVGHA
eukprot:jgi/Chrzof1/8811/Cz03g25130.t1